MADAAPSLVHLPDLLGRSETFAIEGEEEHYLTHVVRVRAADVVTATDGQGARARLEVLAVRPRLEVRRMQLERFERERSLEIWCGAPEGDRADWLVEKLAELSVATLWLVDAERGSWSAVGRRRERWRRLAVAGLRQSRGVFGLELRGPVPLTTLLGSAQGAAAKLLADAEGTPISGRTPPGSGRSIVTIGPSSGFSDDERKHLREGAFEPSRMAMNRLRTETAALAAACWWAGG